MIRRLSTLRTAPPPDPNKRDEFGRTALHWAVIDKNEEEVSRLLHNGMVQPNTQDLDGYTALHEAVIRKNNDMIEFLLFDGRDPRRSIDLTLGDWSGRTALHWIASQGNIDALKILEDHCRDAAAKCKLLSMTDRHGNTALHTAIVHGQKAVISNLARSEPTLNAIRNGKGQTPLHVACAEGMDVPSDLINQSNLNTVDNDGNTPLHLSILKGAYRTPADLLQRGAKPDVANNQGETVISYITKADGEYLSSLNYKLWHYIQTKEFWKSLFYSIAQNNGADNALGGAVHRWRCPLAEGPWSDDCTGMLLFSLVDYDDSDALQSMLETRSKVSLKWTDRESCTALHIAVLCHSYNCARILLQDSELDLHQKNKEGSTAFHCAVEIDDKAMVEMLLATHKIDPNEPNSSGETCLHLMDLASKEIAELILSDPRVQVDARDSLGATPLFHAVRINMLFLVQLLVQKGADPDIWMQ